MIIDDDPSSFQLQPENGIQIKPYKLAEGVDPWDDNALAEIVSK